ncbi:MAG: hypothetical protein LC798_07070 [Chloroflexi bacterium]|nr:hypothetical protein [Chloroflexota bacterium]
MSAYRKTATAALVAVLGWAGVVTTSAAGPISASEWLSLGVALATALGVFAVPNDPPPGEPADPELSVRDT